MRLTRSQLLAPIILAGTLTGWFAGQRPSLHTSTIPIVAAAQHGWHETRLSTGCAPGPFTQGPSADDVSPEWTRQQDDIDVAELMRVRVELVSVGERLPLLGAGFNLEHGLWSCPAFHPVLSRDLLEPFRPALARVDTGLLPAAPSELPASLLNRQVYQSILASEPYAGQWQNAARA